jgi:hypothetical protein
MECKVFNCSNTDLIYSGIDALMYGVKTETVCYHCARVAYEVGVLSQEVNA